MPTTTANETTLCYETFGNDSDPTLLLVNGLGSQLINWEPGFCRLLTDRGVRVVVFDNRDVGLSSKTDGPAPDIEALIAARRAGGRAIDVPYTLTDMADDGFAVLDAVGAERAHIAGMSMGGMIVQRMAIERPDRVRSMTSIMSTTGAPGVGRATKEAAETLLIPEPSDREGYIEYSVSTRRVTGGPLFSADYWRVQAGRAYDRCFNPRGSAFQMAAAISDGDRTEQLRTLSVPSLVIHGRVDPLITVSGGEATAAAVAGAELLVLDEMGHDLPEQVWDEVTAAMAQLVHGRVR